MRLALTVVSPAARQQADVLLEADPATPVAEVAGRAGPPAPGRAGPGRPAAGRAGVPRPPAGPGRAGRGLSLFVDQRLVPPDQPLGESPIRQGSVVSLGSPAGSLGPSRTGWSRSRWPAARRPAACTGSRWARPTSAGPSPRTS